MMTDVNIEGQEKYWLRVISSNKITVSSCVEEGEMFSNHQWDRISFFKIQNYHLISSKAWKLSKFKPYLILYNTMEQGASLA